jgi:tetratricopeptide (TPR) repeat protein/predicted Ser/Thr protein kinase
VLPQDLRTVKLLADGSGPEVDTDEPAGIESAVALARARRKLVGIDPEPVMVGRYRIVERLGQGGMGIVYAAHDEELDRMVAVKVLRSDLASDDGSRRRLLREAQAMAKLSHPNVGHVYEVGRHFGQVFIAMEQVLGPTLRQWCVQPDRTWRDIVRMHACAGDGLAAAHAAGLVHRDYKCENVLVGEDDRPRVLDFGLARSEIDPSSSEGAITMPGDAETTVITRAGVIMGTPAYMAPEQIAGDTVDARADQFSFCVALFEMLYGERPFRGGSMAELRAAMQSRPPLQVDLRARGVPAGLHAAILRGLAVDPEARHASMHELLAALRVHLRGPSRARWIVAGAIAVALGGGGIALASVVMQQQAERACQQAGDEIDAVWGEASRQSVESGLLATALPHARITADKVLPMLDRSADAWRQARTQACVAVEVERTWDAKLDAAAQWCLDERRMEIEALVAELARADANTVENAVEAVASLSSSDPCTHENVLRRLPTPPADRAAEIRAVREQLQRAAALERAGRSREGLALVDTAAADAGALDWPPLHVQAQLQRGFLLHDDGRYDEAERVLEETFFAAQKAGAVQAEADAAVKLVSTVGVRLARHAEGRRWSRHAEAAIEALGDDASLRTADNLSNVALVLGDAGQYAEAKAMHERALAIWQSELGPEHLLVAVGLDNLGLVHDELGEYARAQDFYARALAIQERALGPEHPDVASTMSNIASVHYANGELDQAKPMHLRALQMRERTLGPEHPMVALSLNNLATAHQAMGEVAQARVLHERALAIRQHALGEDHPDTAQSVFNLAGVYFQERDLDNAKAYFERALATNEKVLGADHPHVARSVDGLAAVQYLLGDYARAQQLFERALTSFEGSLGPEHVDVALTLVSLARTHMAQGAAAPARRHFERALAILERTFGPDHAELADVRQGLAEAARLEGRTTGR